MQTSEVLPTERPFSEGAIRAAVVGGSGLLTVALAVGAGLAGVIGLGLALTGCAMTEANFYRGAYRLKPMQEE